MSRLGTELPARRIAVAAAVFCAMTMAGGDPAWAQSSTAGAACDPCTPSGPGSIPPPRYNNSAANAAAAIQNIEQNYARTQQQLQNATNAALNILRSESAGSDDADTSSNSASDDNDDTDTSSYSTPAQDDAAADAAAQQAAAQQAEAERQFDAQLDNTDAADNSAVDNAIDQQVTDDDADRQDAAKTNAAIDRQLTQSDSLLGGVPQDSEVFKPYDSYASDDPGPGTTMSATMSKWVDNSAPPPQDALSDLVPNPPPLESSVADSPQAEWGLQDAGDLTTVPDVNNLAGPGPTQTDATYAQSIVGMYDIIKGAAQGPIGAAKGLYVYGSKMVNKLAVELGLAQQAVGLEPESASSPEPSGHGG